MGKPELEKDARLLREAWADAARKGRHISQREVAARYDVHFTNVSQMVNGRIPINAEWKLAFAEYLGVRPQDIWPDWRFKKLTNYRADDAIVDAIENIGTITALDKERLAELKDAVREVLSRKK